MNPDKPASKSPIMPKDYTLAWMKANNIPLTKENYLHIEYMGQEIPPGAERKSPRS